MRIRIFDGYKKAYKVVKSDTKCYLCRILNEYDSIEEANEDLSALLTNNKTERDLLKEYNKKDIL